MIYFIKQFSMKKFPKYVVRNCKSQFVVPSDIEHYQ